MILDRIGTRAQAAPDKPALIHNGVAVGYAAFAREICNARGFLAARGLPAGRCAIVLIDNLHHAWIVTLALRALGLDTVSAISMDQAAGLNLRDVACVVATDAEGKHGEIGAALPAGALPIFIPDAIRAWGYEGDITLSVEGAPPLGGHILLTSGTTGTFKKILMEGRLEEARNARRADILRYNSRSLHHGFNFGLWTGAGFKQPSALWHAGGAIVLDQREDGLARLFEAPITSVAPLPPMVREIVRLHGAAMGEASHPGLELSVSSGFLPLDVAQEAQRRLTPMIRIRYSATELISIPVESVFRSDEDLFWLTPERGRAVEIVDENGCPCPPGQEGEIRLGLREIDAHAYLDDVEASGRVFRDGFFHPGDMAARRTDGRIRILGRAADVINIQGTKVAVAPIEQHIQKALAVDEVCVFSGLNGQGQEEIVVAIETDREPARPVLAAIARKFKSSERVRFSFLKAFPRTAAGTNKVKRTQLRQMVFSVAPEVSRTQQGPVLARRAFARPDRAPLRVVIYGVSSPQWMAALGPEAEVWAGLESVGEVLALAEGPIIEIPPPAATTTRTIIIPLTEGNEKRRPRQYLSLAPDGGAIDIFADKARFAQYVRQLGLSHLCPKTYSSGDEAEYPCVLKRIDLHSGHGIAIADSAVHLDMLLRQRPWNGQKIILQSFVGGTTEYVTHCIAKDGHLLWTCSYRYEKEKAEDIRTLDNPVTVHACETPDEVLGCLAKLLMPLRYSGPCNIDYKLTDEGGMIIFEINPRLGGSLMMPGHTDRLREALAVIIDNAV